MSKQVKTVYVCGECGYESGKWLGHCPACSSWNTMVEINAVKGRRDGPSLDMARPLKEIPADSTRRLCTGIGELDRVLGGGLVPGSVVLIGGDPGIGKSTLLTQVAGMLAASLKVLYVTGEESGAQLRLRAERLAVCGDMLVLADTSLQSIEAELIRLQPSVLIIDSIQTMYDPDIQSAAGSVTQIRQVTDSLTRYAKSAGCAVFIVGHVTKEGALAGPRMLEHMVDTVLYFEGDRHDSFRLLRAGKNRFGSTNEIGVFEMRDTGMTEVPDPSMLFLSGANAAGCSVTCMMEGTRPMLAEVQALISPTQFSNPRRMAAGMDNGRLVLLLAVLERKAGLRVCDRDIYANVVGGLRLSERASDLAIALSIASALTESALPKSTAVLGEVSLTGEIRRISRLEKRVQECLRLGFSRVILPESGEAVNVRGATLLKVKTIGEAVALAGIYN